MEAIFLKELKKETITTIQYLGNKQRIIDNIFKEIMMFKDKDTIAES